MKELTRVVKPQGAIIISTPDHEVNEIMGIYGDHEMEIPESQIRALMEKYLAGVSYFGQMPLVGTPTARHRFVNLVKRLDFLELRRVFPKPLLDRLNLSAHLVANEYDVKPLKGKAAQVLAVGTNRKAG
jgi:hypothetical protein